MNLTKFNMHDFCICADNAVEGKVSAALLKHSGKGSGTLPLRRFLRRECSFVSVLYRTGSTLCYEKPYAASAFTAVCNTLFAGAAVRHE